MFFEDLRQQYRDWLASSVNRTWLQVEDDAFKIDLYVRKARHSIGGGLHTTLDIASIVVKPAGQGMGTVLVDFIHESHPFEATYIECVHNEPWLAKLIRRDWLPAVVSPGSVYKLR